MLYEIHHDNKSKLWCGPAAIAAVTGHPTSVITALLREIRGGPVKGIHNYQLIDAMRRLGYAPKQQVSVSGRCSLAEFARQQGALFATTPMIVQVTGHYVVLAGRRMVDSHTRRPVWISDAPHRRKAVNVAWTFVKAGEPKLAAPVVRDRTGSNALAKARRLAAKHGIEIEREDRDAFWVTCPALEHDDPLEGSHFATDGTEVLQNVEAYVHALTTGYLEAVTEPG